MADFFGAFVSFFLLAFFCMLGGCAWAYSSEKQFRERNIFKGIFHALAAILCFLPMFGVIFASEIVRFLFRH